MKIFIVTGTNTGVGKTIVTAALLSLIGAAGRDVAMVKPVQTGTATDEPSDAATVARLSGSARIAELSTLEDPLAPDSAARLRDLEIPSVRELAKLTSESFAAYEVGLLEGAGGLLVRLDTDGGTLIDLADELVEGGHRVLFVIVTSLVLGTLNHTELTVEVLRRRGHEMAGLIVGSVPARLDLAAERNLIDLPRVTRLPILASLPEGAGSMSAREFQAACAGWFSEPTRDYVTGRQTAADSTATS